MYIWVDAYARWRIVDPLRSYQAVGEERGAQRRLDDVIHGQITEELEGIGAAEAMAKIMSGCKKIAQIVLKRAAEMTRPHAIELEDVRFRRINYVETVQQKVFERMISERKRIAERSRSESQGRAAEIAGRKSATCWPPRRSATRPRRR
jgi:membrane protease subunit HflC